MDKLKQLINQSESKAFIEKNLKLDVSTLLFKYAKDAEKKLLVEQIAARQKTRKKLPDFYTNHSLILPPSENLEQCTSTELAEFKSRLISNYKTFTDLTGGLGVDFMQFAKRAKHNTYVEPNSSLNEIAQYNFQQIGLNFMAFNAKAEEVIKEIPIQDLIYIDPSRRDGSHDKLVKLEDYLPSIFELYDDLSKKCKQLIIKCSPLIEWKHYLDKLPHCEEIWVLSQRNDCKEICFVLNFTLTPSEIELKVKTYNIQESEVQIFINKYPSAIMVDFGEIKQYLYLPNSSILKAGQMDYAAEKYGLLKLGANTNIYSSAEFHKSFPGRVWSVNQKHKPYPKSLKGKQFNVVSRNFYDKASVIEKKLKLKSGGNNYLLALNTTERPYFIEASLLN